MIEALGPFHCFFTLSSAEKRWHEVAVAILEKNGHEITELFDKIFHIFLFIFQFFTALLLPFTFVCLLLVVEIGAQMPGFPRPHPKILGTGQGRR